MLSPSVSLDDLVGAMLNPSLSLDDIVRWREAREARELVREPPVRQLPTTAGDAASRASLRQGAELEAAAPGSPAPQNPRATACRAHLHVLRTLESHANLPTLREYCNAITQSATLLGFQRVACRFKHSGTARSRRQNARTVRRCRARIWAHLLRTLGPHVATGVLFEVGVTLERGARLLGMKLVPCRRQRSAAAR